MFEAKALSKKYGDRLVVDNLNLYIPDGEIFCLLGQNGAGKSTTINLFLGFVKSDGGQALVNDVLVDAKGASRRSLAYIPEIVMLYPQLTGKENLAFFSEIAGFRYTDPELTSLLLQAGLQKEAHSHRTVTYSKGMRQKVGIAIALAKDARAILMDEPTSGLDPYATDEFSNIVRRLGAEGRSLLIATHDIFNAVTIAQRIGIMHRGKLVHLIENKNISASELQELYIESYKGRAEK
ncbi:ABC transporter ATP-binding protein [Olivibacter jilunii]|uniref:ABC transporter ATP-binding protein n=1 Tax=Olivibacter jilunii TaxID=985016 RepID=UPI003F1502A5